MSNMQLIFAGEVLDGFVPAEVRRALADKLKLDEAKLNTLFSGSQVVIKRGLSTDVAALWVAEFRSMGALLHSSAAAPPAPAPMAAAPMPMGDPQIPAPPPIAVNTPPVTEEITCPACGERQPKRILCRSCACDMPRGIANKEEEAAAERALRREQFMARHGVRATSQRPAARSANRDDRASGYHSRLGDSRLSAEPIISNAADDAPLFGLSFSGRIGRMRNFLGGLLTITGMLWLTIVVALLPGPTTAVLWLLSLAFAVVWGCRLTVLRLHDVNRSAWWLLLFLVPYVGNLAGLVLALWPGDSQDNDYGSPPPESGSLPAIGVLVVLCLTVAMGWNMAWSALQRQAAAFQAEAGADSDEPMLGEGTLPPAAELARALRSDAAVGEFRRYMATPGHRAFAASDGGAWGWHGGAARPDQAMETALADCERRRRPYTPACEVVHLNDHWAMN